MFNNMFLVENNVPDVYPDESRDFQLIARLYDLAWQSTRFSIDSMDFISDTQQCNENLLPFIGTKVGFYTKLNLSDKTHRKVLSAFPYIMRYKGSKQGIQLILNLFEKITNSSVSMQETEDPAVVNIIFYDYMLNTELLRELIEYIRPTGLIINYIFKKDLDIRSDIVLHDFVTINSIMPYVNTDDTKPSGVVIQSGKVAQDSDNYDENSASNIGFTVISKTDE